MPSVAPKNYRDSKAFTELYENIISQNFARIDKLVKAGTSIDIHGGREDTPLIRYVSCESQAENLCTVNYLLSLGADVNAYRNDNCTAMHFSLYHKNVSLFQLLLERGAAIPDDALVIMLNEWVKSAALNDDLSILVSKEIIKKLFELNPDLGVNDALSSVALYIACEQSLGDIALTLIDRGADVNRLVYSSYRYPIIAAATACHSGNVTKVLLEAGADPGVIDREGNTALHFASGKYASVATVENLIAAGAKLNVTNNEGQSALHLAVEYNQCRIVELLLQHQAEIDIQDKDGCTPLLMATSSGANSLVACLLSEGADIFCADKQGVTPLDAARKVGYSDIIKKLTYYHAKGVCSAGWSPISTALLEGRESDAIMMIRDVADAPNSLTTLEKDGRMALDIAVHEGLLDAARCLLQAGLGVVSIADKGISPIQLAASCGNISMVHMLCIDGVININSQSFNGKTPLMMAIEQNHVDMALWLITQGADLNCTQKDGKNALILASIHEQVDLVRALLLNNADISMVDEHRKNGLHYAALSSSDDSAEIAKLWIDAGTPVDALDSSYYKLTALFHAVSHGNIKVARVLVATGANINWRDEVSGMRVIDRAAKNEQWDIVKFLIEHGADIHDSEDDSYLFHTIVEKGDLDTVKFLIDHQADIEVRDACGRTALMLSVRNGSEEMTRFLIDLGANPNSRDRTNRTALHYGGRAKHPGIVALLLQAGAERSIQDEDGWTALEFVERMGDKTTDYGNYLKVLELLTHRQ